MLAACAILAACSSPPPPPAEAAPQAARAVGLRGETTFFEGKLRAEVTVSRGRPVPFKGENASGDRGGPRGGGRHHGGGGGGPMGRGGPMGGGGFGGGPRDSDDGSPAVRMVASSLPPVTLRLRLTNLSGEPLDVQIRDVKSDLGDFAVRPERLLLAPDQFGEVDPMISQLGAPADGFPVTVGLRVGQKTESHEVVLHEIARPLESK